jgi:hypothetical protein
MTPERFILLIDVFVTLAFLRDNYPAIFTPENEKSSMSWAGPVLLNAAGFLLTPALGLGALRLVGFGARGVAAGLCSD